MFFTTLVQIYDLNLYGIEIYSPPMLVHGDGLRNVVVSNLQYGTITVTKASVRIGVGD